MGGQNLRNAPPMERSAPPKEWKLPPEFILPWEPGVPEEPRPGAEAAPLPPEFQGGGRGAPRNRERRRGWRILASVAMALLLTVAAAVPAAELPSPEPPTSAGDPLPTVPPETTPPGGEESPGPVQTPEPITFFSAMMNGSEGFLQVAFPEPETIASAKVTQFDTITQRPFYEDTFGEGIPRADIDAGLYTAFYVVYPPDFDDYWAEAGADTYPTFEMRLTVEQVNGETETYTAADLGRCPQLRGEYDETTNTVTMKVWWDDGEDFPQVVPVAPEQAEGDTLSVTVYVDGEQVDLEAYVINGHNYVQLRDIGRAVDFGVEYDQSTNRVLVDTSSPYTEEATASTPSGVVTIPQTDEPLRLQEGDQVLCDDGTVYEITDLRLWEEPEPLPIYDQTRFPELELPKAEVRRFQSEYGDNLHIRNLYETRRMEYTIYNAAAGRTEPLNLRLGITEQNAVQMFWPWQEDQLTQVFCSAPGARFEVEAWDVYHNGKYLYTEYNIRGT